MTEGMDLSLSTKWYGLQRTERREKRSLGKTSGGNKGKGSTYDAKEAKGHVWEKKKFHNGEKGKKKSVKESKNKKEGGEVAGGGVWCVGVNEPKGGTWSALL